MPKLFTLSAPERLKSRKDIETLFQSGKAFLIYPFRVLFLLEQSKESVQPLAFMVSVPKRNFKKASARNRIRRQIKEAYRLQKNPLKLALSEQGRHLQCAFLYQGKEAISYSDMQAAMLQCLTKLEKKLVAFNPS
jgi:ribonuclease P protein component